MFHVNSYLVPLCPLTVHLRLGSSVNWQHLAAKERWQMLANAWCQSGHALPLKKGKDAAGQHQWGP